MLNVVAEELGFGRERRRDRLMSTHIPYLRHVADTTRDGEPRLRVRIALAMASIAIKTWLGG